MKFTIEIYSTAGDGSEWLLHRTTVVAINPLGARKEAIHLVAEWKRRRANGARVLNAQGQQLFDLSE